MAGHSTKSKGGVDRRKNPYKTFFHDNITEEELLAIWQKCINDAKEGNDKARKEVFDRMFGRPDQKVQADISEIQRILPPWMRDEDKP